MSDKRDSNLRRVYNKNIFKSESSSSNVARSSSSSGGGGSPIRTSKLALSNRSHSGDSGSGTSACHSSLHLRNISANTTSNKAISTTLTTTTTTTTTTATATATATITTKTTTATITTKTPTATAIAAATTTILTKTKTKTDIQSMPIDSANISRIASTTVTATSTATNTATLNELPNNDKSFAIYFMVNFQYVCIFTAILPLVTLFTCFITAYVFQYDEVHETHCRVYNIVPSISAITGVSPQRYFWRFSIALHLGPRVPIAFIYKNYYRHMLKKLTHVQTGASGIEATNANLLIKLILILNCIEIASLGGVTYISNRENYPIHEKIFIIFMICSLCYMLATIKLNDILHKDCIELSQQQRDSIKWKKILFALSIVSTIGLLIFFAKHRFYCHDLAFSWFAFFEYLIAIANMLFHFTVIWDFPTQYMMVVQAPHRQLNELFYNSSSNIRSNGDDGNGSEKSKSSKRGMHSHKID